jgi:hypothetical protein
MSTRDLLGEARGYAAAYLEDVVNRHVGGTVDLLRGLGQTVVASIGPTTSEEIARRGLRADLEASHPKMGVLVREAAERSGDLIRTKRAVDEARSVSSSRKQ